MEKIHLVRDNTTGHIWEIKNRENWPYMDFELELKITALLQTRNWEFIKITKYGNLPEV